MAGKHIDKNVVVSHGPVYFGCIVSPVGCRPLREHLMVLIKHAAPIAAVHVNYVC